MQQATIQPLPIEETHFWDAGLIADIEYLDPNISYAKTRLASLWGVHRNTIRRWINVAVDARCPGFHNGFSSILRVAQCPDCESEIKLTEKQFLHLSRRWSMQCPKCGYVFRAKPEIREVTDLDQRVPGLFAKILRIVGWLINVYGIETTKSILSDSQIPEHKIIRAHIRRMLTDIQTPIN